MNVMFSYEIKIKSVYLILFCKREIFNAKFSRINFLLYLSNSFKIKY